MFARIICYTIEQRDLFFGFYFKDVLYLRNVSSVQKTKTTWTKETESFGKNSKQYAALDMASVDEQ